MNLTCEEKGLTRSIAVYGDINKFELDRLKKCLSGIEDLKDVFVDLLEADFAGTDFVNLLVDIRHRYPADHVKITFLNPNELIAELFELTQLDKVYKVMKTRELCAV